MIKYLGFLLVLNNISANLENQTINYEDDVYYDDDMAEVVDYVYNKTHAVKPTRVNTNVSMNNVVGAADIGVKQGFQDKVIDPERPKRDCVYTGDGETCNTSESSDPKAQDDITSYPFMASVLKMGAHFATGVLVDKRWVLSAAGVFYNVRESIKLYRVRLGSVNCKRGGLLTPLQQIVIYPSYMLGKPDNDLAMLRLAEPVDLSDSIRPVSFTDAKGKVEMTKFLTMYWPRLVIDGVALPAAAKERQQHTSMRVSTQRLLPWKQCWRTMSYRLQELTQNCFCLRPLRQFHTPCLADVGAPVLSEDGLWGIISGWVGEPCTLQDPSPVVVTRITPPDIRFWVESQFEPEE